MILLKTGAGRLIYPPINAHGTEAAANGKNSFQEKYPAFRNCHAVIAATRIFNTSAVGFIVTGERLNNVITAIYPDAPACPTDEYRNATTKTAMERSITNSLLIINFSMDRIV